MANKFCSSLCMDHKSILFIFSGENTDDVDPYELSYEVSFDTKILFDMVTQNLLANYLFALL